MRTPPIVARVPLANATSVASWGKHAFVACRHDGVYGVDVSSPTAPRVLGILKGEGMDAKRCVTESGRLFVAGNNGGLYLYDVSKPEHPVETARFASDAIPLVLNVCAWRGYALVAGADANNGRFVILDVHDMRAPRVIGIHTHVTGERVTYESVAYDGHYVYLGTNKGELHIMNASNPQRIVRVGEHFAPGTELQPPSLWSIAAVPGRAFLADWGGGLILLDTTNPTYPRELGVFRDQTVGANTYAVELEGQNAFVANGWGGVQAVDVSNPTMPRLLWDVEPERASYLDVALTPGLVLAANNGVPQGLDVIKL
jgi:hypothetical protein